MVVDGYIRVSQVAGRSGERFISPGVQREQIQAWATLHGHAVGRIFEELDESGGRADRPLLMQAIARQESGSAQILVVAKLDRFGRSLVDGLAAIERVTNAGGSVVSVADGLDFSTDTGRLVLRLMLSLAEWELDRVRSGWATARAKAVSRGVHMGPAPLGYRKRPDGRLTVDPRPADLVRQLYRLRSQGETVGDLARWLDAHGVPTPTGGVSWNKQTVRSMLANRTYLGEVHHGDLVKTDAHPPIVDRIAWHQAQQPATAKPTASAIPALLRGLIRCSSCGRIMTTAITWPGTQHARPHYRCQGRATGGNCPRPMGINSALADPYTEAAMWGLIDRRPSARRLARRDVVAAENDLAKREQELVAYRDNAGLPARLGEERFATGVGVRSQRVERALSGVAATRASLDALDPDPEDLREQWPTMALRERSALIATVIDCVMVLPYRPKHERLWVIPKGAAPPGLPPPVPRVMPPPQPFRPTRGHRRATPGPRTLDWGKAKTKRAVTDLVEGRSQWPAYEHFQAAGLGLAYANLLRWGTVRSWAKELGLAYVPWPTTVPTWTEARVRAALRPVLRGRTIWPTQREFIAMGQNTLRVAASQLGGPERWAREFGLDYPERRRRHCREWTPERIEEELRVLTRGRAVWPTAAEFEAAGLAGLNRKIMQTHARPRLARKLGLQLAPGSCVRGPTRWTDEAIADALDRFMAGRSRWPTRREFLDAHYGGLYHALEDQRARRKWAQRYGVSISPRQLAHLR